MSATKSKNLQDYLMEHGVLKNADAEKMAQEIIQMSGLHDQCQKEMKRLREQVEFLIKGSYDGSAKNRLLRERAEKAEAACAEMRKEMGAIMDAERHEQARLIAERDAARGNAQELVSENDRLKAENVRMLKNDLDEIHEAEWHLFNNGMSRVLWLKTLWRVCNGRDIQIPDDPDCLTNYLINLARATVRQREEALLRTIGKWKTIDRSHAFSTPAGKGWYLNEAEVKKLAEVLEDMATALAVAQMALPKNEMIKAACDAAVKKLDEFKGLSNND